MRTKSELQAIENFINGAYNRFGNSLRLQLDKEFSPASPALGYSYKFSTVNTSGDRELTVYNIVCAPIGNERTDYRIMMHEYGHIYFGHLDGLYEELDKRICTVFRDYRGELIDLINSRCGIDFADKLIERVIDDPYLNHSLHNIAMDMEVNSKVLSDEDIDEMELDITAKLETFEKSRLEKIQKETSDQSIKDAITDYLGKMGNDAKIKLILPCRYHLPDGTPFPSGLTYPEYLLYIIQNLDQFVKMLISIKMGGNGDTQNIDSDDVRDLLEKMGKGDASMGLDKLMEEMGMSDPKEKPQNGNNQDGEEGNDNSAPKSDTSNVGGYKGSSKEMSNGNTGTREDFDVNNERFQDHRTAERDTTDVKRDLGEIKAGGGTGCGSSGNPDSMITVSDEGDPVDEAIDEVIRNFRSRVVKREIVRDVMKNYNRGILRKVIVPSVSSKIVLSFNPKIVYLIDISGSMNTGLINRVLNTIAKKMKKCGTGRGLKYDIITWSTQLGDHIRDVDPGKPVPRIHYGGGTRMARGMKYFKEHYDPSAILVLISDFDDYLEEWHEVEKHMPNYTMYGFNYGNRNYSQKFNHFKVKNFNNSTRNSW